MRPLVRKRAFAFATNKERESLKAIAEKASSEIVRIAKTLTDLRGSIITTNYAKCQTWAYTAKAINYSMSHTRNVLRKNAIKEIAELAKNSPDELQKLIHSM